MPVKSNPVLIDSHVHTDDVRLEEDLDAVLDAARAQNIAAQVIPATTRSRWPTIKSLCDEHADLHPCYGLHPCFTSEHTKDDIQSLPYWLGREAAVAVGECGLDYARHNMNKADQQGLFAAQLALAREFDLPIVIHAVRAVEDVIRMIRASGQHSGMVHSFNGSEQQAFRLIDLGYHLGFGGAVSYPRANRLRTLISKLPLDAMLLETDAPDQPPAKLAGQRNEPAALAEIWRVISALRTEDANTVAQVTTQNARTLFRLELDHL